MLYMQREELILQQLQLHANVKVTDLAALLEVSLDTVRRDLKAMEETGLVKCVRGGACLPESLAALSHFGGREVINIDQKRQAAIKALKYISSGNLIALNSGTTTTVLAQEIVKRYSELTVVTNNLAAATVLMQNPLIQTILIGGDLDAKERSTYGYVCEAEFARYSPDCAFLSLNAVNDKRGYTDFRFSEIGIMKNLAKNAIKTIAVMDSSKLGKQSKKQVFGLEAIDYLVMDDIPDKIKKQYQKAGVNLI